MPGPTLRTDIVELYVFRHPGPGTPAPGTPGPEIPGSRGSTESSVRHHFAGGVEFLQMRRAKAPLAGSWQPVMGHIHEGESALAAALRELAEETGFTHHPKIAASQPDAGAPAQAGKLRLSPSHPGSTAVALDAGARGLSPSHPGQITGTSSSAATGQLQSLWQLEPVNTFYMAAADTILLCPGFAAQVQAGSDPHLDASHDAFRWVSRDHADNAFLWPGQRAAIAYIVRDILSASAPAAPALRIDLEAIRAPT